MKKILILIIFCSIAFNFMAQTVTGKLVDQNGKGLSGLQLQLYITPKVYTATSSTDGSFTFTNITEVKEKQLPTGYSVSANYPNPFNPKTRINITLPIGSRVKIDVFNIVGQRVLDEINRNLSAGNNYLDIELNGLPNGFYLARISIDEKYTVTKKLMLIYGSQHLNTTNNTSIEQQLKTLSSINLDSIVVSGEPIFSQIFKNL